MIEFGESEIIIVDCLKILSTQFCICQCGIGDVLAGAYPEIKIRYGRYEPLPTAAKALACSFDI